jgi:hypothetical protein
MTDTTTEKTTSRRQVAGVSVTYYDLVTDLADNKAQVVKTAARGEFVNLYPSEEARLDDLFMLVPKGREIEGDPVAVRDGVNRAIAGNARAVIERALNPLDVAFPPASVLPPSVSPPPGGVPPVGDMTTGDTGAPDITATGGPSTSGAGLPQSDATPIVGEAPDAAIADVGEIAAHIEAESPNTDDTVALAKGDPTLAPKVLEAESIATGGDPRKGVKDALTKLAEQ